MDAYIHCLNVLHSWVPIFMDAYCLCGAFGADLRLCDHDQIKLMAV